MNKVKFSAVVLLLLLALYILPSFAQTKFVSQKVTLKDGRAFNLNLPAGYEIVPAAEGLRRVRFFAAAPDGRIFVTDMFDMNDNRQGAVYILDGWDSRRGKFAAVVPFMTKLRNPNSIAFYTDKKGQDWFYLAETDKLTRYKFVKDSMEQTGKPEVLMKFPDYGLGYKYGSWHMTRSIAFSPAGKLYVSVGTSCDACEEKKAERDVRGVVLEMNPDGSGQRVYARNIKNAVGIKWIGAKFYATNEGVDHLGLDQPDDTFYELKDGTDYGWAKCFQANGVVTFDPKFGKNQAADCRSVPASYAFFPAHSSALGFDYFDEKTADANLKNSFLVALHGSTNRDDARGYKIVSVRENNRQEDFVTGFLDDGNVYGRPCDVLRMSSASFLFTDDRGGVVYYVRRKNR